MPEPNIEKRTFVLAIEMLIDKNTKQAKFNIASKNNGVSNTDMLFIVENWCKKFRESIEKDLFKDFKIQKDEGR